MNAHRPISAGMLWAAAFALVIAGRARADVSIGGFIPFVGIGLTNQFETFDNDPTGTFFIADPSFSWGGMPLGPGASAYFDLALLDTGAATHILTQAAASASGFSIQAEGFRGTNFQTIFGAGGEPISLRINDPLGVYAAGLSNRTGAGTALVMNTGAMRGQTSVATLEAPSQWTLPNILGLPMAAHHAIAIRNDQPQIFQHQGRTVRTPNVSFIDLGSGADEGVLRRTNLRIRPSAGFLQGPFYVQNLDILGGNLNFHDNPLSPSVIENGAMFVEVDMANGTRSIQDKELLFDTGADLTVLSELTAARLGFDVLNDEPDFMLEVEGAGGVSGGVPGFYIDELNIDTVGGSFTMQNVPVAVLDLANPNDPANTLDGIIGMHLFNGRNLVIDANPAASQSGGSPPRLYIGDSVMQTHTWVTMSPGVTWDSPGAWSPFGSPGVMWDARAINASGSPQTASVEADSTVYRLTVAGSGSGTMTVQINDDRTLTTYGEALLESGGIVRLNQGGILDAQFVNIDGGALVGTGEVLVGTGPVTGAVRNLSGRISPDTLFSSVGEIAIGGDLANLKDGTLAFDLGGTAFNQHDVIEVERFAFLAGTLEVSLADLGIGPYRPNVGDMFNIISTGDGVVGQFDNLILPAGFQWDVDYSDDAVVLKVLGIGLAGDFNGDGSVNTADYIVWRKTGGTTEQYQAWRTNFGRANVGAGSAISTTGAVPEPGTITFLLFAVAAAVGSSMRLSRQRRTSGSPS
jgi:Aspartyl protease